MERFELAAYMTKGIENLIKDAVKSSIKNPKEAAFLARFAKNAKTASYIRHEYEKSETHIPSFMIASITSKCNMHCKGCYARSLASCSDTEPENQLTAEQWSNIFRQAVELGIVFILLAGGEPLMREDVLIAASKYKKILFPIFTNGTLINENKIDLFDKNRNLMPIVSIEGDREITDYRRGEGSYAKTISAMQRLGDNNILFGASVTVTKKNLDYVLSEDSIEKIYSLGCKIVIFVEYVPIDKSTESLAPNCNDREKILKNIDNLRTKFTDMIFISFPGDEVLTGGCLAAGRGFFHINSHGGAEPCPFSPYSDTNINSVSLLDALNSPLFVKLRNSSALNLNHTGGCALFENNSMVKKFVKSK